MAKIANVALTDTFNTWRTRTNAALDRVSQFAINNSSLYANTLTSNTSFTSKGLATFNGRATVGTNLTVSGNTTLGAAGKIQTSTGAWSHTGTFAPTNITVAGNTVLGGTGKTLGFTGTANVQGWFGVAGRQSISTNLFVGGNTSIGGGQGLASKFSVQSGFSYFATQAGTYNTALFGPRPANDGYGTLNFNWTTTGTGNFWIIDYSPGAFQFNAYKAGVSIPIMTLANTGGVNMQKSMSVTQNLTVSGNTTLGDSAADVSTINGLSTFNHSATVTKNLTVLGNTSVSGASVMGGRATVGTNLTVSGNTTLGAASKTQTSTGAWGHTGTLSVSTNLTVSGNTTLNGTTIDKSNSLSQTLTDGATINWDVALGRVATVTLAAAGRTMAAPTNLKVGTYILRVYQDATGSRTITTWNAVFKWTAAVAPVLSTGAGKLDIITFFSDGTNLYGSYLPDMR
jgi:hypothetical protein